MSETNLKGVKVERKKLADYIQNPQNPVSHNSRNMGVVVDSIHEVGAFRSGAASKGKMLAGNLTLEAMAEAGIEEVLEVTTDGKVWVVVNSEDMTPEQERKAAYYDQRSATLADWNPEQIVLDIEAGLDFTGLFETYELNNLTRNLGIEAEEYAEKFAGQLAELDGMEDETIEIIVPGKYREQVIEWLANGEMLTKPGIGRGVLKRCGLL